VLPFEIKFQTSLKSSDLTNLFDFMQRNYLGWGILVSRYQVDLVEKDGLKILVLPAWFI